MNKNSLQKNKESNFLALQEQNANIGELLKANLGTRRIDPWSFDTATWPSGKASVFEIPTLEGTEAVKEITGIILHWKYERIFYAKEFDEGGGVPPDCHSSDLIIGTGNPGTFTEEQAEKEKVGIKEGDSKCPTMKCGECWNSQFETAGKGLGQACRERRQVFLLQENSILPLFISVPPTSLKPFSDFFMRLATKGKFFNRVVIKLTLNKTKNKGGVDYSEAVVNYVRDLTSEEGKSIEVYSDAVEKLFG